MAAVSLSIVMPGCTPSDVEKAAARAAKAESDGLENRKLSILNAHEYETISLLVDAIIPRDEHSGSASDAGVPMFIDFLLEDVPSIQNPVVYGLAWLDQRCRAEFGTAFIRCSVAERNSLLDRIAYPNDVEEMDLKAGSQFFSVARNLTASGFFSSKMGMEDLQYIGNIARPEWTGCTGEVMAHIGQSYDP